jgi:uncharacterized protein YggU (UPF0235/DUF167 family)
VAAPPERGRANDALCALLAGLLQVPRRSVHIVGGQTARRKVVEIDDLDANEIERRLDEG